jgi:hypothetical protein
VLAGAYARPQQQQQRSSTSYSGEGVGQREAAGTRAASRGTGRQWVGDIVDGIANVVSCPKASSESSPASSKASRTVCFEHYAPYKQPGRHWSRSFIWLTSLKAVSGSSAGSALDMECVLLQRCHHFILQHAEPAMQMQSPPSSCLSWFLVSLHLGRRQQLCEELFLGCLLQQPMAV